MEPEQLQNFNERLSQWVASQGFWFQIRYSMSGSGMKGRAMFHLLRIAFRLFLFLLLVAVVFWIFLMKRTDTESFDLTLRQDLKTGLSATNLQIGKFDRLLGQFEINRLAAEGGEDTFFTSLEARNIRFKMGLIDGLAGVWKPGIISIAKLEMELRAGADDAESAQKLSNALFRKASEIEIKSFEVADATVRWGFSERTQGSIESSLLKMLRTENGWRLAFKGGTFNQNWLSKLEIVNLVVLCDPNGLVFEKAELKQRDGGTVDFSGLRLTGGERPQVAGMAKIRNLQLEGTLPSTLRTFVEGSISGDFRVSGSTNTSEGIGFEGQVSMEGEDSISIRERIHLLKALSDMDYSRNYHRIDFREGSFHVKTIGGGLELTDIKMTAKDKEDVFTLFTLEGNMKVRLPRQDEIEEAVSKGTAYGSSSIFGGEDEAAEAEEARRRDTDFTLRRAAMEAKRIKAGTQSQDSLSLFDRLGLSIQTRQLQAQASERMSRMLRYEGKLHITIPGDAFDRASGLRARHPVDANGRIALEVPLEGNLWELTLKQAEDIYQQGKR